VVPQPQPPRRNRRRRRRNKDYLGRGDAFCSPVVRFHSVSLDWLQKVFLKLIHVCCCCCCCCGGNIWCVDPHWGKKIGGVGHVRWGSDPFHIPSLLPVGVVLLFYLSCTITIIIIITIIYLSDAAVGVVVGVSCCGTPKITAHTHQPMERKVSRETVFHNVIETPHSPTPPNLIQ
jgi:hypothetical protein